MCRRARATLGFGPRDRRRRRSPTCSCELATCCLLTLDRSSWASFSAASAPLLAHMRGRRRTDTHAHQCGADRHARAITDEIDQTSLTMPEKTHNRRSSEGSNCSSRHTLQFTTSHCSYSCILLGKKIYRDQTDHLKQSNSAFYCMVLGSHIHSLGGSRFSIHRFQYHTLFNKTKLEQRRKNELKLGHSLYRMIHSVGEQ